MMDPFHCFSTYINEIFRISFFLTSGLNGGVRFDLVYSCFFKFHVPGPMEICQNQKNQSNSMATWPQGVHDILFLDNFSDFLRHCAMCIDCLTPSLA